MKENATIYLAGGCFWGTEHYLSQINGVISTEVGFANGRTARTTYQDVCHNNTGHAETVKVSYDREILPLRKLLFIFFKSIDPTSLNQQGHDRGTQYRTGIYYSDKNDLDEIKSAVNDLSHHYNKPIVLEVLPLHNYCKAEDYHQEYLNKNINGYCHLPSALFDYAKKANKDCRNFKKAKSEDLQKILTPIQYEVTQNNATESPFQNAYDKEFRDGIYVDITTGEPLFSSKDKFDSGCGWPAFSKPIDRTLVDIRSDRSHGMIRNEVRSKLGDAHLGHVFDDGPSETGGLRYCINSASLRFIPKEEMKEQGYENYLFLFE